VGDRHLLGLEHVLAMTDRLGTAAKWITIGTAAVVVIGWGLSKTSRADVAEIAATSAASALKTATDALDDHKAEHIADRAARHEQDKALFELGVSSFAAALEANPKNKRKASAAARAAYKAALTARDATPASAAAYVQTTLEAKE
jgi:hypothetical protein